MCVPVRAHLLGCIYSYKVNRGVSYMTVCAPCYPRRLAFCYLDDICTLFEDELQIAFGSRAVDFFAMIETIETPYQFIKFGTSTIPKPSNDT